MFVAHQPAHKFGKALRKDTFATIFVGGLWAFALRGDNTDVHASWWLVIAANPQLGKKLPS